jgi:hypothetical protein
MGDLDLESLVMDQLFDESSYDHVVAAGASIVNVDKPTKTARLHRVPAKCAGLRDGFVTKVVENDGRNGSYWAVDTEASARERWGAVLAVCQRCG